MIVVRTLLAALLAAGLAASEASDLAIERGLPALVRMQRPDGSFGDGNAITALAGMALLAGGHTPTRGSLREHSMRALRSVMARQDPYSGYLGADYGNMYAHGFATLYLAECYGMAPEVPVRRALETAVELIHKSQNQEGGWRYTPTPVDADISVTICQVMALRGAYNVNIGGQASQDVIARALGYVRRCANSDGSFSYTSQGGFNGGGAESVPRTAAGAMCLIGAGKVDAGDALLGPALAFLRRHVETHLAARGDHYWYGQYYASQAMFHSPDPADWERYWDKAWRTISARQNAEGLWPSDEGGGPAYATAMALIILQIPNGYLPIFQR